MNLLAVQRILGLLVMLVSITMLPPLGVSLYYGDGNWQPFSHAFFALLEWRAHCPAVPVAPEWRDAHGRSAVLVRVGRRRGPCCC